MPAALILSLGLGAMTGQIVPPPARQFAPAVIHKVPARYTAEARRRHLEGTVLLYAEIGADGRAHRIRVVRGLGAGLDRNAAAALRQWRLIPASRDGEPADLPATIEIPFHLR